MANIAETNRSPSFSYREPSTAEKKKCSWCDGGYPLLVDGRSRFLHSLPEPGGMMPCLAHGTGYCGRRLTGGACVCAITEQRHGACEHWVESVEEEIARKAGISKYGAPNWSKPIPLDVKDDRVFRRECLYLQTPPEVAIRAAIDEVQQSGQHPLLTRATERLRSALDDVASYQDEQLREVK